MEDIEVLNGYFVDSLPVNHIQYKKGTLRGKA
jgi:hypothetical protein